MEVEEAEDCSTGKMAFISPFIFTSMSQPNFT
jgi:hypothetical protein